MMVLVAHTRVAVVGKTYDLWWSPIMWAGQGGVLLFFALSGFLLYLPWLRSATEGGAPPRLKTYLLRRCLRIMPAYYASVIVLAILRVVIGDRDPLSFPAIALHFLFLPTLIAPMLTLYWTLQVEEFFYWLLPLMQRLVTRIGSVQVFVLTCLVSLGWGLVGARLFTEKPLLIWFEQMPIFLPAFSLGIIAAQRWRAVPEARTARALVLAGVASYVVLAPVSYYAAIRTGFHWNPVLSLALAPAMSAIVLGVARGGARVLEHPILRFVGGISFSLYLWHLVVLRVVPVPDVIAHSFGPRVIYTTVLSLTVAVVSYLVIERPFLHLRPTYSPTTTGS